ncbi:MAG: tetratricopeptide repeat protein [Thermoplasmata archaeon]
MRGEPGGEGIADLTVAQRVVLHLSLFSKHREEFDVPLEVTQQGIAQALGLSRSHIALELKKLLVGGSLENRLAHVQGAKSRRKVYFNAFPGERIAATLRERAHSREARWIGPDGAAGTGAGTELIRLARREGRPLSGVYLALLGGQVVDLRPTDRVPTASAEPAFVGRQKELANLEAWLAGGAPLMLITGLPGVGKTALARAFLGKREGVWVRVFPFDSASSLVASLAMALSRVGRPRLLAYLKGNPLDYAEVGLLLSIEASGLLLVFDDVTASPEASQVLRLLLDRPAPGGKLLLTARETPTFVGTKDRLEGRLAEIRLAGLTREECRALLRTLGRGDGWEKALELTQGHPLLLRLVATGELPEKLPDTQAFLLEEVLTDLSPEEQEALFRAAVLRRPVPPDALAKGRFPVFAALRRKGLLVENGGRYGVHDLVAPAIRRQGGEGLRSFHREAARSWQEEGEWVEAVYHLARGGRRREGVALVGARLEEILEAGGAADLAKVLEQLPADPPVLLARARALDTLGQWTRALELVEKGLKADPKDEKPGLLLLRGRIASKRGDLARARQDFLAAEESAARRGADRERGLALYGLGIVWRKEGQEARALADLARAVGYLTAVDASREVGRARMETGLVHLQQGRFEEAIREFQTAAPHFATSKGDTALLQNNLAIAHKEAGRPEESLRALEASRRFAEAAGMVRPQAYALLNAADLLARLERLEEAEAQCDEAEALARGLEDPVMLSTCRANRGLIARGRGDLADALALYEESLETLPQEATVSRAHREVEMSDVLARVGERDRAAALREKARGVLGADRVEALLRQLP